MFNKATNCFISVLFIALFSLAIINDNAVFNSTEKHLTSAPLASSLDNTETKLEFLLIASTSASQFTHVQQRTTDYFFVAAIVSFSGLLIVFYLFITPCLPRPWYLSTRFSLSSRLGGWQDSNLQYKAKLTFES